MTDWQLFKPKSDGMTDRERLDAYLQTIPGDDAAAWFKIADAGRNLCGSAHGYRGDGTVDRETWEHLNNITKALAHLAQVMAAAEHGTPATRYRIEEWDDIPF